MASHQPPHWRPHTAAFGVLSSARSQSKGHPTHTSLLTSFLSLLLKIIENKKLSSTKHFGNSQCLLFRLGWNCKQREKCAQTPRVHPGQPGPCPRCPWKARSPRRPRLSEPFQQHLELSEMPSCCRGNTARFEGTRGPHGSTGRSGRRRPRPRRVGLDGPALLFQAPHLHRQVVPAHPGPTAWLKFTSDMEEPLSEKDLLLGSCQTGNTVFPLLFKNQRTTHSAVQARPPGSPGPQPGEPQCTCRRPAGGLGPGAWHTPGGRLHAGHHEGQRERRTRARGPLPPRAIGAAGTALS